jgi:septum formation protein
MRADESAANTNSYRMPFSPKVILASQSQYRRALLERLHIPFTCETPEVDERRRPGETPRRRALRLARAKARAIAARHAEAIVIGSDQVAVLGREILDKPGNYARAAAQLRRASGRTLIFVTAVCVINSATGSALEFVDRCRVRFRKLSDDAIRRYLQRDRPYDCAGSFRSEALGITLVERMSCDDPTGLIGLPLIRLSAMLRAEGIEIP